MCPYCHSRGLSLHRWRIEKTFDPDEIIEASLTFYNARDWTGEDGKISARGVLRAVD